MSACMYACVYVSLSFPAAFLPCQLPISSPHFLALPCVSPLLPQKSRFFQRFRKGDVQKHRVFQMFGKRRQEAQASKRAGRGNRAWDPCFATPFSGTSSNCRAARAPPSKNPAYLTSGWGGGGGIVYPLVSIRHAEQCRRIHTERERQRERE